MLTSKTRCDTILQSDRNPVNSYTAGIFHFRRTTSRNWLKQFHLLVVREYASLLSTVGSNLMAIRVTCTCGKQFQVKEELAGKRGKCAACGQVLSIPTLASSAVQEKATPAPQRACPICWETLQPNAVICLLRDRTNGTQVLLEDRPPRHFSTLYSYTPPGRSDRNQARFRREAS